MAYSLPIEFYFIAHNSKMSLSEATLVLKYGPTGSLFAGYVHFMKEGATLPANKVSPFNIFYMPIARLADVMSTLRHEKPLYLWVGDAPDYPCSIGTTSPEPIGDED